ncbi:MAG: DUF5060 domain-containing protein [Bacteroidota bacterium]
MFKKKLSLGSLFLCCVFSFFAQNYECKKWEVVDIGFRAVINEGNPFVMEFGAIFTHENGKKMNVPGFYNGDDNWMIRFCPSEVGVWVFETYAAVAPLDGQNGKISVAQNTGQHGAVQVHPTVPQRFIYEDGTPYFPLAFEVDWLFALDANNVSAIPRTKKMVKHLVNYRFNKVIMNVYASEASWGEKDKIEDKYNFAQPTVFPFGGTNENPDYSILNVDFFKHFDRVISHLNDNEIIAHLMIYVWNKKVNWAKPGSDADNMYFDYVVRRYQAFPNLIWDISKEALAYGRDDMDYIVERIERLKKQDAHERLVTVHDYKFCYNYPELLDFISIQEWRPNLYNQMLQATKAHPRQPVFNVEHGGYEQSMHTIFHGAYTDAVVCLERSYECIFAGTYTTYYWQNSSWYEVVYEPFELPKAQQPKFEYYKILMDFFEKYDYSQFIAKQYVYSPYCLSNEKDQFIYLVPSGMYAVQGSIPPAANHKKVKVQWFDPLTGAYSKPLEKTLNSWMNFIKPESTTSPFALMIIEVLE